MKFNPEIHNRKSIRLKDYDYSQNGAYFVTVCTHERELFFEKYSELVNIINFQWNNLTTRYLNIVLDEFVIMPNHIHGIIFIDNGDLKMVDKRVDAIPTIERADARPAPTATTTKITVNDIKHDDSKISITIGGIICTFKSLCTNQWLKYIKENNLDTRGKFWQRNYYEKIIRNEEQLNKARQYIIDNPTKWEMDKLNPVSQTKEIKISNEI